MKYDVIILGGGASGLFLADFLKNRKVLLIEHNSSLGEKIKISGGGKCNITNKTVTFKNYYPKSELVKEVLKKADNKKLLEWIKSKNLKVYLKGNQYFFSSSSVLLNVLKPKCEIMLNTEVLEVKEGFEVITDKGVFKAKNVVVALGGKSYKKIGASEKGFKIAKNFGHTVAPLKPALVGLSVQPTEYWFKKLSGISFRADVYAGDKKFSQNILFSHRGITGPAILNASLYWEKGKIKIDFLAGRGVNSYLKNPNRQIVTQIPFPRKFIKTFLETYQIKDKKIKYLTTKELEILKKLENYQFAPAGTFGFERAEVTKGGVITEELNFYMESKKIKGLYFTGEVVNVTGELGGYNFQWAFSSAYCAFLGLSI